MWVSIEPLCKHVCLCAHCNECIRICRDWISPLQIWLKMSFNVFWGFCESLVRPKMTLSVFSMPGVFGKRKKKVLPCSGYIYIYNPKSCLVIFARITVLIHWALKKLIKHTHAHIEKKRKNKQTNKQKIHPSSFLGGEQKDSSLCSSRPTQCHGWCSNLRHPQAKHGSAGLEIINRTCVAL